MKYAAIITYASGVTAGATIKADSLAEAWKKLQATIPPAHIQSVQMAEIPTHDHEIE